jgi:hypothetical protein
LIPWRCLSIPASVKFGGRIETGSAADPVFGEHRVIEKPDAPILAQVDCGKATISEVCSEQFLETKANECIAADCVSAKRTEVQNADAPPRNPSRRS